jgi:hypothetical protein
MAEIANIAIEEARELVSNRLLWPFVRDFLWDFAPQVHPSWVEDLFSRRDAEAQSEKATFEGLGGSAALREMKSPRVRRYMLSSLGVEPCFHTFPKEDGSRLLLIDGATLESVVKWLGALACAGALRHVTDGATVRGLKSALSGVYPEVFGYTMYFGEFVSRRDAEAQGLQTVVVEEGYTLLLSALSNVPSSLVSRLKFKLPKGLGASASLREMKLSCIFKLLKLKFPEAYKLCCS